VKSKVREASGKLLAIAVLVLAAFVLFKLVLGFISAIAWTLIAVIAVIGVLWALNRLL
jgi:hypothetical protein